jgi:hypothetical protein
MKKSIIVGSVLIMVLAILTACTKLAETPIYDNPNDPTGSNYFPPKITELTSSLLQTSINDSITFTATAVDSNEDGTIANFIWSLDGLVYGDTTADSVSFVTNFFVDTTHTVWVKAIDNDGVVSPLADSIVVTVLSVAPVATIVIPTIDTVPVIVGQPLNFSANWSDIDGVTRGNFAWYLDNVLVDTLIDSVASIKFDQLGNKTVSVTVTDEDGLVSIKDNITVIVEAVRPVITSLTDTVLVYADSSFELVATAEYLGVKVSKFYWQCVELGIDDTTAGTLIVSASIDKTYKIAVRAVAEDGYESYIDTVYFTVAVPGKPRVTPPVGFEAILGSSHDITVEYGDDNGKVEEFFWGRDSRSLTESTTVATKEFTFNTEGEDTIWVMVKDNDGQLSNKEFVVVTVISLDVPSVFGMNDTAIILGNPITLTATSPTGINYLWAVDGVNFSSSTTGSLAHTFLTHGEKIVLVKVEDVDGVPSAVDTIVVSVIHTGAPLITGDTVPTTEAMTPITLTVNGEGKAGIVKGFIWKNGTTVDSTTVGENPFTFETAGTYEVIVSAFDNNGFLSLPLTITVTVNNAKPTIEAQDSYTVYKDTPLTLIAAGDDADGDITGYYWYWSTGVKDTMEFTPTGSIEISFGLWSDFNVRVRCNDDAFQSSDTALIVVSVTGTAPTATGLSISMKDGDFLGSYTFNDVDPETEEGSKFKWFIDGAEKVGETSKTLPGLLAANGKNVTFEVTPKSGGSPSTGTPVACSSAVNFNIDDFRTYDFSASEHLVSAVQAEDGYMLLGADITTGEAVVIKIQENNGGVLWTKRYKGDGLVVPSEIIKSGTEYVMVGYTRATSTGAKDMWACKITEDGTIRWQESFGGDYDEAANGVVQVTGGTDYLLAGYKNNIQNHVLTRTIVLRIGSDGDSIGTPVDHHINTMSCDTVCGIAASDGGYMAMVTTRQAGSSTIKYSFIDMTTLPSLRGTPNAVGYVEYDEIMYDVISNYNNNGFVVALTFDGVATGITAGGTLGNKFTLSEDEDKVYSLALQSSTGFLFAGESVDGQALIIDYEGGNMPYPMYKFGEIGSSFKSINLTDDGDYIVAGHTNYEDYFVAHINASGVNLFSTLLELTPLN